jgi:hypothetical protein
VLAMPRQGGRALGAGHRLHLNLGVARTAFRLTGGEREQLGVVEPHGVGLGARFSSGGHVHRHDHAFGGLMLLVGA